MVVRAPPPAGTEHNPEKSKASWMSLSKHTCGMSETGWTAHAHQQSLAPRSKSYLDLYTVQPLDKFPNSHDTYFLVTSQEMKIPLTNTG